MMNIDELISGEITIGGGEFRSSGCLAKIVTEFSDSHENVSFEIYSGNNENIIEQMDKGLIDIGLFMSPIDLSKYDSVRMHQKECWGVLVRNDSPLAEKTEIRREDLLGLKLIAPRKELVIGDLSQWCGNLYEKLDLKVSYNLLYNVAAMVEQGMDAALCLQLNAKYDDLKFIPLAPRMEHSTVLAWRRNQITTPAVAAFIKYLKKVNDK